MVTYKTAQERKSAPRDPFALHPWGRVGRRVTSDGRDRPERQANVLLLLPPDHTKAEKFLFRLAHDTFGICVATGLTILAGACAWAARALLGLSGSTITTVLIYAAAAVAAVALVAVTLGLRRVLAVRSTSDEELFRETSTRLQGLEAFDVGGDEYLAAWQAIYDEIAVLRTVP